MFTKRIIPCLDVHNGRVVKGVNFVNLKDAGDPVEVASMYDKSGFHVFSFTVLPHHSANINSIFNLINRHTANITIFFHILRDTTQEYKL